MNTENEIKVQITAITSGGQSKLGTFALVLGEEEGNRRLPIVIGMVEAQAILYALQGVKLNRPLTHDLIANIFKELGVKVEKVVITELKDNTFYARLYLRLNDKLYSIDARPSDSIAIAVRTEAPIFVSDKVMQQAGLNFTKEMEEEIMEAIQKTEGKLQESMEEENVKIVAYMNELKKLEAELKEAIANEDFELAAKLRDEIQEIKAEIDKETSRGKAKDDDSDS